jgi:dihydroorotate dehydrogenase (fumarate)
MPDLSTSYLGLPLRHPVMASAGPLSHTLDGVKRLAEGGAAAIVLFSLFEEQIRAENEALASLTAEGADSTGEASSYFPPRADFVVGPDAYLDLVRRARQAVDVPVIASLNGITASGWVDYARQIHAAGAQAIELNLFHIPADVSATGREVEDRYVEVVQSVCEAVPVPVAVKVGPYFSAMGEMAARFVGAGARGLVLFNRFYQPDIDLERLELTPTMKLSSPAEIRLPLLWLGVLYGRLPASLAATTGVHTHVEVAKYLLAGADAVMTTSALLEHGPGHIRLMVEGLRAWMERKGFQSVSQIKGSMSQRHVADPTAFDRANYLKVLQGWRS